MTRLDTIPARRKTDSPATTLTVTPRVGRRRRVLPVFASTAALAFVLVAVTSPMTQHQAVAAEIRAEIESLPAQQLAVAGDYDTGLARDAVVVTEKPKPIPVPEPVPVAAPEAVASGAAPGVPAKKPAAPAAPPAGVPDPGSAKAIAYQMVLARGWGEDQYNCLVLLWQRESGWNHLAMNKSSGAYGIPQSLPGSKMATAGADWQTNPATQITWGLGYIAAVYGNPCGAWAASETKGWY